MRSVDELIGISAKRVAERAEVERQRAEMQQEEDDRLERIERERRCKMALPDELKAALTILDSDDLEGFKSAAQEYMETLPPGDVSTAVGEAISLIDESSSGRSAVNSIPVWMMKGQVKSKICTIPSLLNPEDPDFQ
ncbi:hypothetical protein J7K50_08685 [bacterium]|nr:hypothetical protein [bacterium]